MVHVCRTLLKQAQIACFDVCRYGVSCNVGDTNMRYDLVVKTYYWISIVVSNTRCALTF